MPADVQETSDLQHREQHLVAPDDDVLNGPDLIVLVVAAAIETAPEKSPAGITGGARVWEDVALPTRRQLHCHCGIEWALTPINFARNHGLTAIRLSTRLTPGANQAARSAS